MDDDEVIIGWSSVAIESKCFDAYDYNTTLHDHERLAILNWFGDHGFEAHLVRFVRYEEGHLTIGIIRHQPKFWIDEIEVVPHRTFPWPTTNRIRLQALRR